MCCFSYISMVVFGTVYCSPHACCVLHDIIQHIYKVFHQLKQCMASYDWLWLVKTGPSPGPSPSLKRQKTGLDGTFKPYPSRWWCTWVLTSLCLHAHSYVWIAPWKHMLPPAGSATPPLTSPSPSCSTLPSAWTSLTALCCHHHYPPSHAFHSAVSAHWPPSWVGPAC